jgi:cathepsin L
LKNEWGTFWGELGFMRFSRNRNNNCGIATDAVYAIA